MYLRLRGAAAGLVERAAGDAGFGWSARRDCIEPLTLLDTMRSSSVERSSRPAVGVCFCTDASETLHAGIFHPTSYLVRCGSPDEIAPSNGEWGNSWRHNT